MQHSNCHSSSGHHFSTLIVLIDHSTSFDHKNPSLLICAIDADIRETSMASESGGTLRETLSLCGALDVLTIHLNWSSEERSIVCYSMNIVFNTHPSIRIDTQIVTWWIFCLPSDSQSMEETNSLQDPSL